METVSNLGRTREDVNDLQAYDAEMKGAQRNWWYNPERRESNCVHAKHLISTC